MTCFFKNFVQPWMADPARRQRGSVLSGLLIIVTFLSILVGALMSELSSGFLITHVQSARVATEATVNSAAEMGILRLKNSTSPAHCATDASGLPLGRGPWFVDLNGKPAYVTEECREIVPDQETPLAGGIFRVDGTHDMIANRYLVGDRSGNLYSYSFGSTIGWVVSLGAALTAPVLATPTSLLAPIGNRVALLDQKGGGAPTLDCYMGASAPVQQQPAAGAMFPTYTFFGDSAGNLYVYDSSCQQIRKADAGDSVVGDILVLPGTTSTNTKKGITTTVTSDEVFVVATAGSSAKLAHWRFSVTEITCDGDGDCGGSGSSSSLNLVPTGVKSVPVPGDVVGTTVNSRTPTSTSPIQMWIVGASGRVAIASISVVSGNTYMIASGTPKSFTNGPVQVRRAPHWCRCPQGDLIGVAGSDSGTLYVLDAMTLNTLWSYDIAKPINTTPTADANGNWYFGADDGNVYDVEIPANGNQMFKAASFPTAGSVPVRSSPVVDSCPGGLCVYFGAADGTHFVQLGNTRIIDLHVCVSTAYLKPDCSAAAKPKLWAQVRVGTHVPGGVQVTGWSYSQ
jgi:hypothetical protein